MYAQQSTSIGLPEAVERAGAYALLFITGILLLMFERNPNVRHHAQQSIWASLFLFAPLFMLRILLNLFGGFFHLVPLIGGLLGFPFVLLSGLVNVVAIVLWLYLIVRAATTRDRFMFPGSRYIRRIV